MIVPRIYTIAVGAIHVSAWGRTAGAAPLTRGVLLREGFDRILVIAGKADAMTAWRSPNSSERADDDPVHVLHADDGAPFPRRELQRELDWLSTGSRRIVLCERGESRSPALAVAFLLQNTGRSLEGSIAAVADGLRDPESGRTRFWSGGEPLMSVVHHFWTERLLRDAGVDLDP